MTTPLATEAELEAHLRRTLDPASAALALAGGSGAVRDYCRWGISRADETLVVDGTGGGYLLLPTLHLVSVAEVRVDGTVLTAGDYTWSASGQLYRPAGWPRILRGVEVDCVHGYEPVPDTPRLVALEHAARIYDNPQRVASKSVGGVSESYDLSELEMGQLDAYRLP
jgi:hypothetical protein